MKRAFIIHAWGENPEEAWYPWLKKELEAKGYSVKVPVMPNTDEPDMEEWINKLAEIVKKADEKTTLIGHSIGCQTIIRYLARLQEKVGKVILVTPWLRLKPVVFEEEGAESVAKPWLETQMPWEKIKNHSEEIICLFSDDDPYVYVEDAKIFEEKLGTKTLIEKNKGHYNEEGPVIKEIPTILKYF